MSFNLKKILEGAKRVLELKLEKKENHASLRLDDFLFGLDVFFE